MGPVPGRRRVDQLKMLAAIREILHNEDACTAFFEPFCIQFEKIVHAVTLRTSLYNVESCITLCDLVEEYLASLILSDCHTKHRILIQKDNVIDWKFWMVPIERMLAGENVNTILRALAFLFNVWGHIPMSSNDEATSPGKDSMKSSTKQSNMFDLFDDQEGLRWNCTVWLLSPKMWKTYFCHWNPLVRAYYLRLICWRVASVGSDSGLLSSVLYANYNSDARELLAKRLRYTCSRFTEAQNNSKLKGQPTISAVACKPALNRSLVITFNPASSQSKPPITRTYPTEGFFTPTDMGPITRPSSPTTSRRIDPYEVFDDVAYSFPTVPLSSDLLPKPPRDSVMIEPIMPRKSASTSAISALGSMIKKKWANMRNGGSSGSLKKMMDESKPPNEPIRSQLYSMSTYPPSLTSSSTMSSSSLVRTPASNLSQTDIQSPQTFSSLSSILNLDMRSSTSPSGIPMSPTSLTMSLIPPPPQILRKRPEISRPLYKFSLDYIEPAISEEAIQLGKTKPLDSKVEFVTDPCLPFDFVPDQSSRYKDSNYVPPFDFGSGETTDEEDQEASAKEFEYAHLPPSESTRHNDADNMKYWKYGGRSLNEWDATLQEFQDFVNNRRNDPGVLRLEDMSFPFMIAEIPAKAVL